MIKRPTSLENYVGQDRIRPIIQAEMKSGRQFRHMILFGMPGTGKSSLAGVIANILGYEVHTFVASSEWSASKVVNFLLGLSVEGYDRQGRPSPTAHRHLIVCDEVHKLPDFESWYTALEDAEVYVNGKPNWTALFTMVGATTEPTLPRPFQDRFPLQFHLEPYEQSHVERIIAMSFPKLKAEWVSAIAQRSRGVPRLALSYAESVTMLGSLDFFDVMGIDSLGLNELDRRYIAALEKGEGRALSISTLGAMCLEQPKTLILLVEPYLLQLGLLEIGPKGRMLVNQSSRGRRQT